MSYIQQILQRVEPRLSAYKSDLELDASELEGYHGELLHGSRDTGTDLLCFGKISSPKQFAFRLAFLLRSQNTYLLHGVDGVVKEITRDKAIIRVGQQIPLMAARIARTDNDPLLKGDGLDAVIAGREKNLIKQFREQLHRVLET